MHTADLHAGEHAAGWPHRAAALARRHRPLRPLHLAHAAHGQDDAAASQRAERGDGHPVRHLPGYGAGWPVAVRVAPRVPRYAHARRRLWGESLLRLPGVGAVRPPDVFAAVGVTMGLVDSVGIFRAVAAALRVQSGSMAVALSHLLPYCVLVRARGLLCRVSRASLLRLRLRLTRCRRRVAWWPGRRCRRPMCCCITRTLCCWAQAFTLRC